MKYISEDEQGQFKEFLSYMHVGELKLQLEQLGLSSKGFNKNELITRLIHYALTGKELPPAELPSISKACKGRASVLGPQARMLFGSYKNDLETRNFFKKLIGSHFHFTAQGIDWLRERWLEGCPPTYADFAHEWQAEYERNKGQKRPPKQEWAYIRFVQGYTQKFPQARKKEVNEAWEIKRKDYIQKIRDVFNQIS